MPPDYTTDHNNCSKKSFAELKQGNIQLILGNTVCTAKEEGRVLSMHCTAHTWSTCIHLYQPNNWNNICCVYAILQKHSHFAHQLPLSFQMSWVVIFLFVTNIIFTYTQRQRRSIALHMGSASGKYKKNNKQTQNYRLSYNPIPYTTCIRKHTHTKRREQHILNECQCI